ncbi:cadmium-translocating P-type ATPase [Lysobacter sp. CW239]|uniref:heavy metal translocating P-type ATPase n=1 Tax=Lysobacteraceae TaxID=32033 RepID=UPI000568F8D2|nr:MULTISPECIES: heavy metal translocating P-type ATPase [Lysobacter]QOD90814.1 cadmium-translocating P-type ATPase [Lysobacter sp. CW239]
MSVALTSGVAAHPDALLADTGGCHHCGEALPATPARVELDGAVRAFCCDGCAAAAQWIREADLGDYYRLRSEHAGRVDPEPVDLAVWDRDELLAEHAHDIDGGREITLLTDGMRCAACAWLIDRVLAREPGVLEAGANAVTGRIRLAWNPAETTLSRPLQRLVTLGYRPYLASGEARESARRRQRNRDLIRVGVAGMGAMQAMMLAGSLYLDTTGSMPVPTRDFFRWLTFLVSTPVVFYAGWPFITGAWRELRHRQLGMDTLIAGSTLLAYFASVVGTIRGSEHVWYDAAVMFVFLLSIARLLEQRARNIANAQVDALARARPAFATRELADGSRESIPLSALLVGDLACVAVGEVVPADGELVDGQARFEEALLTGESSPVDKAAGDRVYAGTVCREQPARLRVTETGSATRLSQLARLVEQAQAQRPALARAAERIAHYFVSGLLLATVAVYFGWRAHDPSRAFEVTLALLVISCPCALSLAVPTALAAAHGALARLGVLAVRENALDRLADATDVVFDKTGTLSDGRPVIADVETFGDFTSDQALRIAAALERDSGHPIAAAFAKIDNPPPARDVLAVPGQGIQGDVEGRHWRLGQAGFAAEAVDDGRIWLGDHHPDDGWRGVACFQLAESQRPDARAAVDALRAQGLAVHLSSGDAAQAVERFAHQVGIEDSHARQSPEDKLAYARGLQQRGRIVAMVGDGLNDAPVLAGADVSLAIGEGAALAQRAADLVLTGRSLTRVPEAIAVARRTRRVIRQNIGWALGYNLLALPLAAAGLVTPWIAALGMALSSLIVTANALRLTRVRATTAPSAPAATTSATASAHP